MSAAFKLDGRVFWGTNGAIELCVDLMADEAATRLGADAPLAQFLREQREQFYMGTVVYLDPVITDAEARRDLATLLDAAIQRMVTGETMSEYGRSWAHETLGELSRALSDHEPPAESPSS